jgi:hypothetical protein
MRHVRWMAVTIAVAAAGCAHTRQGVSGGGGGYGYPDQRDRHANLVLFPADGRCKIIAGPETHIAFPGRKVIWRVINLCKKDTEIEIVFPRREPADAPANPFVESGDNALTVKVGQGFAASNTFSRTVREAGAFRGRPARYFYEVGLKDDPSSRLEPEMDIWP